MRLELLPDSGSYALSFSSESFVENGLKGGLPVQRLDIDDTVFIVNCKFSCTPKKFEYLRQFLAAYYETPQWFDILLVTKPFSENFPLTNHKTQIVPGSVSLDSFNGLAYTVSMQFEAYEDEQSYASSPYPFQYREGADFALVIDNASLRESGYIGKAEESDIALTIDIMSIREPLKTYSYWPFEANDVALTIDSMSMRDPLKTYSYWPFEASDFSLTINAASMRLALISYVDSVPEANSFTLSIDAASLI